MGKFMGDSCTVVGCCRCYGSTRWFRRTFSDITRSHCLRHDGQAITAVAIWSAPSTGTDGVRVFGAMHAAQRSPDRGSAMSSSHTHIPTKYIAKPLLVAACRRWLRLLITARYHRLCAGEKSHGDSRD